MGDRQDKHWSSFWLAGLIGIFLMAGSRRRRQKSRSGRADVKPDDTPATPDDDDQTSATDDLHNLRTFENLESNSSTSDQNARNKNQIMSSEANGGRTPSNDGPLKQITPSQWLLAVIILIAVPAAAYFSAFYIYPYVQDQLEGESAIDAVLAEYGVAKDAETQLLTIRSGDLVNSVAVNGTLEYARREQLSFGLAGTIASINVDVGDRVSEGDVLMSLQNQAVVMAQEELQDASLALQNAEQTLEDLINPDQQKIDEANLKTLQADRKLSDAELKLEGLLKPSELEIENAQLDVRKAEKSLQEAEIKLADLMYPPDIDVEKAALDVDEAEQAVADTKNTLEDFERMHNSQIASAKLALSEAEKEHQDALQALLDLHEVDSSAINELQLGIDKAQLAVIDAETAVSDAEKALEDARLALEDTLDFEIESAKAKAELAAAKLDLETTQKALEDAQNPYDEGQVLELRDKIAEAESDITVAQDQLAQLQIETATQRHDLETPLYEAREAYQDVFLKWLGMDITKYGWQASPGEIFADIGKSLPEILTPQGGIERISRFYEGSDDWLEDDPETPWDETVVAGWTEFFVSDLRFDCIETEAGILDECVNIEFKEAWEELDARSEAHRIFILGNSQKTDNAEDAVEAAMKSLDDLRDQREDLLEPTDEDVINDLQAKVDVARLKHRDAERKLENVLGEADERRESHAVEHMKAGHVLTVAKKELSVAEDAHEDALEALSDQMKGAHNIDVSLAQSRLEDEAASFLDAEDALQDLAKRIEEDYATVQQELAVAQAYLASKTEILQALSNPDPVEIDLLRQEIEVAVQTLAHNIALLSDLNAPDALEIDIARQEIAVALDEASTAREELGELLNPDPVTVAVRRAEVATAQENLDAAHTAIERSRIIAPFDGVVAKISAEIGTNIAKDAEMVEIVDPSIVEISGNVDEVDVLFLQVGDPAAIELEALGAELLAGHISDIAAFGESNQGVVTYPVTIQTEQPSGNQLPEGLSAVAEVIIREQNDQLLVPIQALFGSVNQPVLLISNPDGTLQPHNVTLGISDDFWTVIESGVSEGDTLLMAVVGADTSQFGGFGAIRTFSSGGPPRGR